jgi:preprotein translocase subunit YajC
MLLHYKMRPLIVLSTTVFYSLFNSTLLFAQEAAAPVAGTGPSKPPANSIMMNLPMIVLFVALFYFLIIAPQKKSQKQQQEFQKGLARGDEVVTSSGILGKVAGLTDRVVILEVAPDIEIRVLRSQVQAKLGEIKLGEATT